MQGTKLIAWSLCLVVGTALATSRALSQDAGEKPKPDPVEQGMKAYQAVFDMMRKPVAEHEWIAKLSGRWTGRVRTYTAFAQKDPLISEWTREARMEKGGLFLTDDVRGKFVGADFEAGGILGYDKDLKQFVGAGSSNLGSFLETWHGTLDASGKVLTLTGEPQNRMGMKWTGREVFTLNDDGTYHQERIAVYEGGLEIKEVEIDWTREGD